MSCLSRWFRTLQQIDFHQASSVANTFAHSPGTFKNGHSFNTPNTSGSDKIRLNIAQFPLASSVVKEDPNHKIISGRSDTQSRTHR